MRRDRTELGNLLVPCLNDWSSRVTFSLGNSDPTSFGNAHMKIQWNCTLSRNKRTMTNDYHYKIEDSCRFYLLTLGDEEKWRGWIDSIVEQFWHLPNANFRALVLTWPNYSLGLFESQALPRWFFLLKVRVMRGPRKKRWNLLKTGFSSTRHCLVLKLSKVRSEVKTAWKSKFLYLDTESMLHNIRLLILVLNLSCNNG